MCMRRAFLVGLCGIWVATAGYAGSRPLAVSPGEASKIVLIAAPCPTFTWSEVDGARWYELVVYRLGGEGADEEPILQRRLPGDVDGWTPSLEQCLDRGGGYAWSVRAIGRRRASEWSAPALFQVAAGPSVEELEAALEVVQQYLAVQDPEATAGTAGPAGGATTEVEAATQAPSERVPAVPETPAKAPFGRTPAVPEAPSTVALVAEGGVGVGEGWDYWWAPSGPLADLHVIGSTCLGDMLLAPGDLGLVCGGSELMLAGTADGSYGMKIRYNLTTANLEIWGHKLGVDSGPWLMINGDNGKATFAGQIFRYKGDIETVTASTAYQADDHLFFDIGENELWTFEALLWVSTSNATGDFDFRWQGPSGSDVRSNVVAYQGGTVVQQESMISMTSGLEVDYTTSASIQPIYLKGLFWGGDGGTIRLQWAQRVASGTTSVYFPSFLEARRVHIGSFYP